MKEQEETIRRKKLLAKINRLSKMQERNWQKHFAKHPEQLLPGAEVERAVPLEEMELNARIIGGDMFVQSSRGRRE